MESVQPALCADPGVFCAEGGEAMHRAAPWLKNASWNVTKPSKTCLPLSRYSPRPPKAAQTGNQAPEEKPRFPHKHKYAPAASHQPLLSLFSYICSVQLQQKSNRPDTLSLLFFYCRFLRKETADCDFFVCRGIWDYNEMFSCAQLDILARLEALKERSSTEQVLLCRTINIKSNFFWTYF